MPATAMAITPPAAHTLLVSSATISATEAATASTATTRIATVCYPPAVSRGSDRPARPVGDQVGDPLGIRWGMR